MNRILIRVDANEFIGYGHFFRCLSIAQMIQVEWQITFAMSNPDGNIVHVLKESNINLLPLATIEYVDPDSGNEEIPFDLDINVLNKFNCVLTDGYFFGKKYHESLSASKCKVFTLSDSALTQIKADVLINSGPLAEIEEYEEFNVKAFALGIDYLMLRAAFIFSASKKMISASPEKIFISFGGADYFGIGNKVIEFCARQDIIREIHVVGSLTCKNKEQLITSLPKVHYHLSLNGDEVAALMRNCTLGILPSSGIMYEAIACGLPVISCWYAENQKHLHEFLSDVNGIPSLGFVKEIFSDESLTRCLIETQNFDYSAIYAGFRNRMVNIPNNYLQLFKLGI